MKDEFNLKELSEIYKEAMEVENPSPPAVQRAIDIISRDPFHGTFFMGLVLAGAGACILILWCAVYLSQDANPKTWLYPIKRNYEAVQIALAPSQLAKLELHLDFAEERIREVEQVRGDTTAQLLALEGYKIELAKVNEIVSVPYDETIHNAFAQVEAELADNVEELEEMAAKASPRSQAKIAQVIASQTTVELIEEYAARQVFAAHLISNHAKNSEDQDSNECVEDEDEMEFDTILFAVVTTLSGCQKSKS